MPDPRDTGGVSARAARRPGVAPPPRTNRPATWDEPAPATPSTSDTDTKPDTVDTAPTEPSRSPKPKKSSTRTKTTKAPAGDSAKAGRGWGSRNGSQYVFRVRVPQATRATMERDPLGRSFGLIAYEAVATNVAELRERLTPKQPAEGMAPIRRPRFYTEGGAPKVDLYLSVEERESVNQLAADIGVAPSELFREALALWCASRP